MNAIGKEVARDGALLGAGQRGSGWQITGVPTAAGYHVATINDIDICTPVVLKKPFIE